MRKKLKIAQISAEIEPFTKSGGLANVMGSLPRTIRQLGHSVVIVTPFYEDILKEKNFSYETISEDEPVEIASGIIEKATFLKTLFPGSKVPVYFIASKKFFGAGTSPDGRLYGAKNDNARFLFFSVAALALLKKINYKPDVIHCHDWHTGLIPYFLKGRYQKDEFWKKTACLFTIHNLVYQLGHDWWLVPESERDDGRTAVTTLIADGRLEQVNFVKRAIMSADAINAVSETYRDEILTSNFGEDLHRILKNRENIIFGIVNGIDYNDYNPLTDAGIFKHYSHKSVGRKKDNKRWIQRKCGLKTGGAIPLIAMTSRIAEQKGFLLLLPLLPTLMSMGVQMAVIGDGDEEVVKVLKEAAKLFPKQFFYGPFDSALETSLYAGADFFLLPSRFEPCGINQMIALRYGCIPIVHHIGGLADTIVDFNPRAKESNGFAFSTYDSFHLLAAIVRAIETYKHKDVWNRLVKTGLREANSWIIPAKKYVDLYMTTMRLKRRSGKK